MDANFVDTTKPNQSESLLVWTTECMTGLSPDLKNRHILLERSLGYHFDASSFYVPFFQETSRLLIEVIRIVLEVL